MIAGYELCLSHSGNFPPISAKGKNSFRDGNARPRAPTAPSPSIPTTQPQSQVPVEGGEVVQVEVPRQSVSSNLIGQEIPLKGSLPATEGFTVDVDPLQPVARVKISGSAVRAQRRRVERMVPVEFQLMPIIGQRKRDFARFFLKQAHRVFQLSFSDQHRSWPIRHCRFYSFQLLTDLAKEIGEYHTQALLKIPRPFRMAFLTTRIS